MTFGTLAKGADKTLAPCWRALCLVSAANDGCRDNWHRAGIAPRPMLAIERRPLDRESFRYQKFAW